ncbi:ABC transporter permease [Spirochaeta cellobiosiphila]|uniref:ABC transporter permease n=1 Tax=Spirochaeta cellobiosiphila TaxID=504483 RepID=UPI0003FF9974|nr:ABC transporter permease [Spirochaeta cellobiosiphila]
MDILITVLQRALIAGTPLLLATLGEIVTERSGVLNLGVEGMMSIGAVVGFGVAFTTGHPWLGVMAAVVAGSLYSLIHGLTSVSLRVNQTVSGLALTMLGVGLSSMWGKPFVGRPLTAKIEKVDIPGLSDIPFLGPILFQQPPFFYIAIVLGLFTWIFLYRTIGGIRLRSVGENPKAAESQGISVAFYRYGAIAIGGAFSGLAGANLALSYSNSWVEGMVAGRGWIAVALTIFALWNPKRAFIGAFLFGGIFVLQYILQPLGIAPNLLSMLPYVTTLAVLLLDGLRRDKKSLHSPAFLGEPFKRGER